MNNTGGVAMAAERRASGPFPVHACVDSEHPYTRFTVRIAGEGYVDGLVDGLADADSSNDMWTSLDHVQVFFQKNAVWIQVNTETPVGIKAQAHALCAGRYGDVKHVSVPWCCAKRLPPKCQTKLQSLYRIVGFYAPGGQGVEARMHYTASVAGFCIQFEYVSSGTIMMTLSDAACMLTQRPTQLLQSFSIDMDHSCTVEAEVVRPAAVR